jgi:hypothetical protein
MTDVICSDAARRISSPRRQRRVLEDPSFHPSWFVPCKCRMPARSSLDKSSVLSLDGALPLTRQASVYLASRNAPTIVTVDRVNKDMLRDENLLPIPKREIASSACTKETANATQREEYPFKIYKIENSSGFSGSLAASPFSSSADERH